MGGSKSNSSTSQQTSTQNVALDGVDGVTVAGSENITVNMTDGGAFDLVAGALDYLSKAQESALKTVSETSLKGLDRINESNRSESIALADRVAQVAMVGAGAYVVARIWGSR